MSNPQEVSSVTASGAPAPVDAPVVPIVELPTSAVAEQPAAPVEPQPAVAEVQPTVPVQSVPQPQSIEQQVESVVTQDVVQPVEVAAQVVEATPAKAVTSVETHCANWLADLRASVPNFTQIHPLTWIEQELGKLVNKLKGEL